MTDRTWHIPEERDKNDMKNEFSATEMRLNLRRARTLPLTHLILEVIRPHIRDDEEARYDQREEQIFLELRKILEDYGAEVITDQTREEAGLPPRGPDGWTMEEIIAVEQRRLELLTKPIIVPSLKT
jgi:hypothetical protein